MKNDIIALISRNYRKFLLPCSIAILVILLIISIVVMIWVIQLSPDSPIFMNIAGKTAKLELIKLIGWGMGGLIATLSVIGLLQRAAALDKQNAISETGHVHELFKTATDPLGSEKVLVRIAAFNEFYHIVEIEPTMQNTIFNILFAHLEQIIRHENYQ